MKETKRQDLPAGLWVVATPIGNLMDLSERGKQALREADVILCEDTRRTAVLLAALEIPLRTGSSTRLVRLDAHATDRQIQEWSRRLQEGASVALVSDAGTPSISDPGAKLVEVLHQNRIQVTPIPGPSAVPTLLSASGFQDTSFTFRGFFPRGSQDRKQELLRASLSQMAKIHIWFESPSRILEAISSIQEDFPDVQIVAAKELTKVHEKIIRGSASEVLERVKEEIQTQGALGEWCFAIEFPSQASEPEDRGETFLMMEKTLECLLGFGVSVSEASSKISQIFSISKKKVYQRALELAKK